MKSGNVNVEHGKRGKVNVDKWKSGKVEKCKSESVTWKRGTVEK